MRRKLFIYALAVTLAAANPAISKNVNSSKTKQTKTDLREIVLSDEQMNQTQADYQPSGILIASSKEVMGEDASPLESSLENQDERKPDVDNGFLNIFKLKGGVAKSDDAKKGEVEKTVMREWLDGNYATGRWFGARPVLEDHGVTINSSLLYSPSMKTGGGAYGENSGKGYSLFNLSVTVDTEKAGLWKGGTFYTLYQRKAGYGPSGPTGAMGDWMNYDGWEGRQINQISECWYQQKFFDNKIRLKMGKQDANADFGYLNSGWDFMNLAFSVNPTIPMPTYPDQSAFGFVAEINPKEWLSIRNGIYSKFNVPFNISEIEVKPVIKGLPGRYSIGAWEMSDSNGMSVSGGLSPDGSVYTNNFNRNFGAYAQFEQMVYKENKKDENDMQGLIAFGQFGVSPTNRNDMCRYAGGGLHYKGLIPKRDNDKIGIAIANGTFAQRLGDITSQVGDETAIEVFYRFQVTPWFYLQPDVQFISNPSGMYPNSMAFGLRSVITF